MPLNDIVTPVLARLTRREELLATEVEAVIAEILGGRVEPVQAAGFLVALRTKGETEGEIAALVRAMHRHARSVEVEPGAVDTCGTGGDRAGTINVSTLAAIVAAAAGARVVKHGNRAASSQCGSADVLEALGVRIDCGPEGVARCVREAGIGFCFAPVYHPGMRHLGPVRKELGVPTTFNYLGPLLNPARVTRQVVGVSDPEMAGRMLHALHASGSERAMIVHGDDGLDELTTTTTSTVYELVGGQVRTSTVDPADLGLTRVAPETLRGGDAAHNADAVRAVLGGQPGPRREVAVLNAAAALVVADLVPDLAAGVAAAGAAIDRGAAAAVLDALVRASNEAGDD
ncbi:MAG: anthranilate phosphoribosyltransferase [Actinomycetota bacterium]